MLVMEVFCISHEPAKLVIFREDWLGIATCRIHLRQLRDLQFL